MKRKRLIQFLLVGGALLIGGGIFMESTVTHAHPTVEWERSERWWEEGRCKDCHQQLKPAQRLALDRQPSAPPRYHCDPAWPLTHGRKSVSSEDRCLACHRVETCRSCHATRPDTHTRDFVCPRGDGPGLQRHVLLARARPSACMMCHVNLVTACAACHTPREMEPLADEARQALKNWIRLRSVAP